MNFSFGLNCVVVLFRSLINGLKKRKVVSTSRSPGHTKHFQTIFLTNKLCLCDCPGLVFPALDMARELQLLCGLYPIAQAREPYSAIRYLLERVRVEEVYNLAPPDGSPAENYPWSGFNICESYAIKRGYRTKGGRDDTYRAGESSRFSDLSNFAFLF
jgi:ribosome biogenesis GTPase A